MSDNWPKFPHIGCKREECSFIVRGFGLGCEVCNFYLHPGDKHYKEVAEYYREMAKVEEQMRVEATAEANARSKVMQGRARVRCIERGTDIAGTIIDAPVCRDRQWHPNLFGLFIPDDPKERTEAWLWNEIPKYFEILP